MTINSQTQPTLKMPKANGFSFIELMVAVVIMGLLTSVVVLNVLPSQNRAMVEKARSDVALISQAIEMYRMETLRYPAMEDGLDALTRAPVGDTFRQEGFVKSLPKDPWNNPYQYLVPGEFGSYDVFSLGADGRLGGSGLDADIGNWLDE